MTHEKSETLARKRTPRRTAPRLDIATLSDLVEYNPETGRLYWKVRPRKYFESDRIHKAWNARNAGAACLTHLCNGYLQGGIMEMCFKAHRVAWALYHGSWPENEIEHINEVNSDNRICNLRETDRRRSVHKRKLENLTSLHPGVCFRKETGKWIAAFYVKHMQYHLGSFATEDEAARTVEKALAAYDESGKLPIPKASERELN